MASVEKTFKIEIEVTASCNLSVDTAWGSDADGNRGTRVTYVEDVHIEESEWKRLKTAVEKELAEMDWEG